MEKHVDFNRNLQYLNAKNGPVDGDRRNDELTCTFKVLGFGFGVMFTCSIALMFQSLSIGSMAHVESDNCFKSDGAGSTTIMQSTSSTSGGWDVGGVDFQDAGGTQVVMVCTAFKLAEGIVADKLNAAFKSKEAPNAYMAIGGTVHVIGLVMAMVLGVYNPDDEPPPDPDYEQRYCDAEDTGPPGLPEGASVSIYMSAIIWTMIAGWLGAVRIVVTVLSRFVAFWTHFRTNPPRVRTTSSSF